MDMPGPNRLPFSTREATCYSCRKIPAPGDKDYRIRDRQYLIYEAGNDGSTEFKHFT